LDFKRKKKRGISQKTCKIWLSPEGYRITWRREVHGVQVPPAYQACVRTALSGDSCNVADLRVMWDFVNRDRRLHRTMKAAVAECEKHHKLWLKAIQCTGIRALCELFGRCPSCVPHWATKRLNRRMLIALLDTTPHRGRRDIEEEEEEEPTTKPTAEPATEEKPEKPKKRKVRSDKGKTRKKATSTSEKPKRKTRSDKGKPRGPRKPKGTT